MNSPKNSPKKRVIIKKGFYKKSNYKDAEFNEKDLEQD